MREMITVLAVAFLSIGLVGCESDESSTSETPQKAEAEPSAAEKQSRDDQAGAAQRETEKSSEEASADLATTTLSVEEMVCEGCSKAVTSNLEGVSGVAEVSTSFEDNRAEVTYDPDEAQPEQFVEALSDVEMKGTEMDWEVDIVSQPDGEENK